MSCDALRFNSHSMKDVRLFEAVVEKSGSPRGETHFIDLKQRNAYRSVPSANGYFQGEQV